MKPLKTYTLNPPREIQCQMTDRIELWPDQDTESAWFKQLSFYKGKLVDESFSFRGQIQFMPFQAGDIVDRADGSETNLIVESYEDDSCGDGCCQAVYIKGKRPFGYWPNEFKFNLKANGVEEVK